MKKILVFFLLSMQLLLVACFSKEKNKGGDTLATPWETEKESTKENNNKKSISADAAFVAAEEYLKKMSLDEEIGQLFMVNLELLDSSKGSYQNFYEVTEKMKETLKTYPIGGVILFSKNMATREKLQELTDDLQNESPYTPLYIATEELGGKNSIFEKNKNLRGSIVPHYAELGRTKTSEELRDIATTMGKELKELGFNLNLAPIADIADEENNASYANQCFSSDEKVTANMVADMVVGLKHGGVATTLRHFPGVGSNFGKVGQEFINDAGLMHMRDIDFVPFRSGIDAGADMIMISHVAVTKVTQNTMPASMSELIINGIIRDELRFDGVVITDAMNVPNITSNYSSDKATLQALVAGADMILMPEDLEKSFLAVKKAVSNRSLDMKVLNAAVLRILQNKIQQGIIE